MNKFNEQKCSSNKGVSVKVGLLRCKYDYVKFEETCQGRITTPFLCIFLMVVNGNKTGHKLVVLSKTI